jgi:hypothetical protein
VALVGQAVTLRWFDSVLEYSIVSLRSWQN